MFKLQRSFLIEAALSVQPGKVKKNFNFCMKTIVKSLLNEWLDVLIFKSILHSPVFTNNLITDDRLLFKDYLKRSINIFLNLIFFPKDVLLKFFQQFSKSIEEVQVKSICFQKPFNWILWVFVRPTLTYHGLQNYALPNYGLQLTLKYGLKWDVLN